MKSLRESRIVNYVWLILLDTKVSRTSSPRHWTGDPEGAARGTQFQGRIFHRTSTMLLVLTNWDLHLV